MKVKHYSIICIVALFFLFDFEKYILRHSMIVYFICNIFYEMHLYITQKKKINNPQKFKMCEKS
jgi:hypothetical protein